MQCRQSTAERITTHAATGRPTPKTERATAELHLRGKIQGVTKAQKSYNKTTDRPNKKAELIALISGSTILQARPQTPHGTALRVPASAGTRLDPLVATTEIGA